MQKKKYNKYNIYIYENKKEDNVDLVIVISDNIRNLDRKFNLYDYKERKIPIYIVTGNLDTSNIVNAVNITCYTSYIKNSCERIVKKAFNIVSLNAKK